MIDTHCHLDAEQFDTDRAEVLERAFASGVEKIIIPAIEPSRFEAVQKIVDSDERIFCGMGVHPHNATEVTDKILEQVEELSFGSRVVAIGEIGLDYFYDFAPKDVQQRVFQEQLRIAKRRNLPVIIHNRDSDDDMLRIVEKEQDGNLRGVFHCFSGSPAMLEKALKLQMHVSFTGNITFKKSTLAQTVQAVPPDRIMIETDSPYMTPTPFRGKRNEPAFVRFVAEKIAELHSLSFDEVVSMTSKTAKHLFQLGLILCFLPILLFSQQKTESNFDEEKPTNTYQKTVGFGFVVGTNTIVATFKDRGDESADGLFTYGASATYGIFDDLLIEAAWLYGKDSKVMDSIDVNSVPYKNPNINQVIDISLRYMFRPGNKMNFFVTLGPSYFMRSYGSQKIDSITKKTNLGINYGIGLMANIPTSFGLITPVMEWRVSMVFNESTQLPNGKAKDGTPLYKTQTGYFYSIPRFTLQWYPWDTKKQ